MNNAIKRKYMTRVAVVFVVSLLICGLVLGNGALIRDALFPNELDYIDPSGDNGPESPKIIGNNGLDTSYLSTLEDGGGIGATSGASGHQWLYTDIDSGKFHLIMSDQDGFVYTRGSNEKQQLGLGAAAANLGSNINSLDSAYNNTANYHTYWQPIIALNHIWATSVSAGGYHSVAIGYEVNNPSSYKVYTWGDQTSGKLGNAATSGTTGIPQDITSRFTFASGEYPVKVSAGEFHTLLLTSAGNVWAWGSNSYGQLGVGNTTDRNVPTKITAQTGFTDIAAGFMHSLALKSTKIWAWGANTQLQLGSSTSRTLKQQTPVAVHTGLTVHTISAALHNAAVNTSTNTLYTWGDDRGGKLGRGFGSVYKDPNGNTDQNDPANATSSYQTISNVKMAVATEMGTVAINSSTGRLRATGDLDSNFYGLSHNGTLQDTSFSAAKVAGNGYMTIAVTSDSQLYAFGNAAKYSEQWYANPKVVSGGTNWSDGTVRYDTNWTTTSYFVKLDTADNLKRLTPTSNIIGLPTNYSRNANTSSGINVRNNITIYNSRVKVNAFTTTNFAVAQVTKAVYDAGGSYSGATWKSVSTKGVIVNREGYYVVRYTKNGSTAYTRFTIANKSGPEVTINTAFNNANPLAAINVYDAFGVKSVRVQGTARTYNPINGSYTTFAYDTGVQSFAANIYNGIFDKITANSNTTFTVTAVDIDNNTSTTSVTINTVVNGAQSAYSGQFNGSSHAITPLFHRPSDGAGSTFNLSTFNSRYGGNGYSYSVKYAGGDGDFSAGSVGPITVNTNPYTAEMVITKSGADTGIKSNISNMSITKKPITVVAHNISKGRSQAIDPALTYTATGVVAGYPLAGTLARAAGQLVGTYAINIGTLASKNYAITFTGATFTILDDIKPVISVVTASITSWTNGNVVLTVTAYDEDTAIASVVCNGAATSNSGQQYSYTATENGTYTFTATDTSGNANTSSYTVTNIDRVVPVITFSPSIPTGEWTGGDITFTFNAIAGASGVKAIEYTNNGGSTWTNVGSLTTYTTNVEGTYTYQFRATSNSSVTGTSSTYLAKIDKDAPDMVGYTLDIYEAVSTATGVVVIIEASDASSGVSHITYGDAVFEKDGDYHSLRFHHSNTYNITIVDNVGNTAIKSITVRNIDELGATVHDVDYPEEFTKTVVPLTFKVTDEGDALSDPAGVQAVYINGNLLTLQDGVYNFIMDENIRYTIQTIDNVGNISEYHIDNDLIFAVQIYAYKSNDLSGERLDLGVLTIGESALFPIAESVRNYYYSGWKKDDGEILIISYEKELNFTVRYDDRKNMQLTATWTLTPIYYEIEQGDITFRYTGGNPTLNFDLPDGVITAFEYYSGATIDNGAIVDEGERLDDIPFVAGDYAINIILMNVERYWLGTKAVYLTIEKGILTPIASSLDWADEVTITVNLEEAIEGAFDAIQYSNNGGVNWETMIWDTNQVVIDWDNDSIEYVFRAYKQNVVVSEISVPIIIKVDTYVPTISFEASGEHNIWSNKDITFDIGYSVGISGLAWIEVQRDGGQWLSISQSGDKYSYTDITNGTENFKFRVTNYANIITESEVFTSKIDKVTPTVSFIPSGVSGVWTAQDNIFNINNVLGYSGIQKVEYTINGGESWIPLSAQDGEYILIDNITGERIYRFRTTSNAGLIGLSGEFISRIDKTAPTISFAASSPNDAWSAEDITFNIDTTSGPSGVAQIAYTLDGSVWQQVIGSSLIDRTSNIEEYKFRVINGAGIEAFSAIFISKIDKQVPEIVVSTGYDGRWTADAVVFTFDIEYGLSGAEIWYTTDFNSEATQAGITVDAANPKRFYLELDANIDTNYYFEIVSGANLTATGEVSGYKVRIDKVGLDLTVGARDEQNRQYIADVWTDNTITFRFNLTFGASGGTLYYSLNEGQNWYTGGEITINDNNTSSPNIVLTTTQNRNFSFKLVNGAGVEITAAFGNVKIDKSSPSISITASYQTTSGQVMAYNGGTWVNRDVRFAIISGGIGLSGVHLYYSIDNGVTWTDDNIADNGISSSTLIVTASQQNDYKFKIENGVGKTAIYEFNRVWIDKAAPSFNSVTGEGVENARYNEDDPAYKGWYISDLVITFDVKYGLSGGVVEYTHDPTSGQWYREGIANNSNTGPKPTLTVTDNSSSPQYYYFRIVSTSGVLSTGYLSYGLVKVDTTDYFVNINQYVDIVKGNDYANVNVHEVAFKRGEIAEVTITPNDNYDFKNTTHTNPDVTSFELEIKDSDYNIDAYFYKHINVVYNGLHQHIKGRLTTNVAISVEPAQPNLTFAVEYYSGSSKLDRVPSSMGTYQVKAISNNANYIIDNGSALMTVVYFEGDGTCDNPHLVDSRDDFGYINDFYNNPDPQFDYLGEHRLEAYYRQAANIALTANFPSIAVLSGTFDGANWEFTGTSLTVTSSFGIVKELAGGLIKNVGVRIDKLTIQSGAGANVGFIAGNITNGGAIEHSYAVGNISINSTASVNVGSLAGKVEDGGAISHSFADVNISNISVARGNIGGIVGKVEGAAVFSDLFSIGQITLTNADEASTVLAPFANSSTSTFSGNLFLKDNTYYNDNIINDLYEGVAYADYGLDILGCDIIINDASLAGSKSVKDLARIRLDLTGLNGNGGTSPFEIYNLSHLQAMDNYLWASYILMEDIDAAGETLGVIGLGKVFSGSLEGGEKAIKNAVINANSQYVGLFAIISGSISDIRLLDLQVNVARNVDNYTYAGGIAGLALAGARIEKVIVSGEIIGEANQSKLFIGGLVGLGSGLTIGNSLSTITVKSINSGIAEVGGIAGRLEGDSIIDNSFALGKVDAGFSNRGQAGIFTGVVANSTINNTAGVSGNLYANGIKLQNEYGLAISAQIANNILSTFDTLVANQAYIIGNDRLTDIMANIVSVFEGGNGTENNPYKITTAAQLMQINNYLNSHFRLLNNISLSGIPFESIGKGKEFTGSLNGNSKAITGLSDALFETNAGTIRNLTINVNINKKTTEDVVFGTAAKVNKGTLTSIIGEGSYTLMLNGWATATVGGIAGINKGIIDYGTNSFSTMDITAPIAYVGSIAGISEGGSEISGKSGADKTINIYGGSIRAGKIVGWSKEGAILNLHEEAEFTVTVRVRGSVISDLLG